MAGVGDEVFGVGMFVFGTTCSWLETAGWLAFSGKMEPEFETVVFEPQADRNPANPISNTKCRIKEPNSHSYFQRVFYKDEPSRQSQ